MRTSRPGRPLREKHLGLLLRMLGYHTVVCSKRTVEPLVKRGFMQVTKNRSYEMTREGTKFALAEAERLQDRTAPISSWAGISIGNVVLILKDGRAHA
jgi:hypothetical protein